MSYGEVYAAYDMRARLKSHGIELHPDRATWLVRQRFSPAWIPVLFARAEAMNAAAPRCMVVTWLERGTWAEHVMYSIATRAGLWSEMSDGGRFGLCRRLRQDGLCPWHLAAMLNAAKRLEDVRNPLAFVARLIRDRAWVQFTERVRVEARNREVTSAAVVSLVRHVLVKQRERMFAKAWAAGASA